MPRYNFLATRSFRMVSSAPAGPAMPIMQLAACFLLGVVVTMFLMRPGTRQQRPVVATVALPNADARPAPGEARTEAPIELKHDSLATQVSPREAGPTVFPNSPASAPSPTESPAKTSEPTKAMGSATTAPYLSAFGGGWSQGATPFSKTVNGESGHNTLRDGTASNGHSTWPAPPGGKEAAAGEEPSEQECGALCAEAATAAKTANESNNKAGAEATSQAAVETALVDKIPEPVPFVAEFVEPPTPEDRDGKEPGHAVVAEKGPAEKAPKEPRPVAESASESSQAAKPKPANGPQETISVLVQPRGLAPAAGGTNPIAAPSDAAAGEPRVPLGATEGQKTVPIALREKVKECLRYYFAEPIAVNDYSPWGTMHCMLAFGVDSRIFEGRGRSVNAAGWLCYNGRTKNQQLFKLDKQGQLEPQIGPGVQGHPAQFLAMLAQTRVKTSYPIHVQGEMFTVGDLLEREMKTCRDKTELTFKLIAFSRYLDTNDTWTNDEGQTWDFTRIMRQELAAPIIGAACGGTHRLMGLTYAVEKRRREGRPLDGQFGRADKYLRDYVEYLFKLQNPDGSFSTNWFAGPADNGDLERKLQTGGHMLEWLLATQPPEELGDRRAIKSVEWLADTMLANRGRKWAVGPRGHALRALVIYDERVLGAIPGERSLEVARVPSSSGSPPASSPR